MKNTTRLMSLVMVIIMLFTGMSMVYPAVAAEPVVIQFDANGGHGVPVTVTVNPGTVITLPSQQPRKPGMVFRGWAFNKADADAGNITYSADQTHQVLCNSSATLYASYAYSVTLHPGNRGWGSTQQLYKFPNKDLELFHHKADIQPNYGMLPGVQGDLGNLMVFVEWNTAQLPHGRGDGASYHEAYTANAPADLYAIWGNPVLYSADGGVFPESGTNVAESYVTGYDSTPGLYNAWGNFGMPVSENAPYKPGSRLYTENGENVYARVYADGNIYRMERSTSGLEIPIFNTSGHSWADFYCAITSYGETGMLLHAIWEPSVTYKANGGEGKDVVEYMTYAGTTRYNYKDYTVLSNSFTNSSAFIGWNTKPDGTGTSYAAGDVISGYGANKAIVLYAQWQTPVAADRSYRVSFNAMEGYLESAEQSVEISYGQKFSDVLDALPVPTRQGYIFKGWVNDETGSELILDTEYYALDHDTSYTAQYELHSNHSLQKYRKKATCSTEGYYVEECKACGYINNITYPKTTHTYENWNTIEDGRVAQFCSQCLTAQIADSTPITPQEVIAYHNYQVDGNAGDYAYVDTLNYIGPAIDNGPGSNPFGADYFSNLGNLRNKARASNPNIKIVLTVFNRNISVFESWLSGRNRESFANYLVNTVVAYGFDGLDIDYEFPANAPKSDFVYFLEEVRERFDALEAQTGKHYILSIATPASVWAHTKFDLPGCAEHVDYINMMNYDLYCGTAFPYTHHHTPPYDNQDPYGHIPTGGSVQGDIALYKSLGISGDKIVAGSGMYSRRWTGVGSANNGLFQRGGLDESNIHYDVLISGMVNSGGYTRYWDNNSMAPYLYNPHNQEFISYDDRDSLAHKINIIRNERVRGLMIFDYITCDGTGIIPFIGQSIGGATLHACTPVAVESKASSCTEDGYVISRCTVCDSLNGYVQLTHEGHYTQSWTVKTAPTKDTAGVLKGTCIHCNGEATREIAPLGYTVTFDPNGGSVIGSTKFILQKGESYADKLGAVTAVKGGTEFLGWMAEGYMLDTNDSFEFDSDITFTAVWAGEGEHTHSYTSKVTKAATCIEDGVITYTCHCGEAYTEAIAALGHEMSDWTVIKEATATEAGKEQRSCRRGCCYVETREIPATGGEPTGLAVSSDGPNLTVSGMADVKDVFIALGDYNTYADVKANAVVRLTPTKLNGVSEYTYTLKEGGYYTVLVRYNDGTQNFLYEQINVTEPAFAADGLQLTVSNLENVKVIRTAYGEYTTVSQIKKASTARAFTAKNDIKGADSYKIQYRYNGVVTVAVQYNDGYTKIYTYEVEQKVPTFVQSNNVVTIGNIDDLYVIRYAPGRWATSSEIKKAPGSQAIKADAAVDGVITVKGLKAGTYTFCVQYNDESYNYYVITVE